MDGAEKRRKRRRIVFVVLGVAALLTIVAVVIVLYELPRPFEIRSNIVRRPVIATPEGDVPLAGPPSLQPLQGPAQTPPTVASPAPAAPGTGPTPPSIEMPEQMISDYLVDRYVVSTDPEVHVCENLGTEGVFAPRSRNELHSVMVAQASGQTLYNPFVESAIAPLGSVLQVDSVSDVVDDIWNATNLADEGVLDRAEFYADAALATADLYSQMAEIERISQHAYHLYVLSRIAAGLPGFGDLPEVQDLCEDIESRIEQGIDADIAPEELAEENAQMLQLIADAGLSTGQVGYNPFLPQTVTLDTTVNRLALSAPWMFQQFGGGVSLSGR